ncbi:MAG TPA: hypothetical protein PLL26_05920 [Candidatus Dojkabacteria bacterium]|nr:hypothetical protein [Candidatus Dojkabacteria bacterium]
MGLIGEILISVIISVPILLFLTGFLEGSGGVVIKGTKKYDKYHRDAEDHVKYILRNGSGSSKEELQEWWDTYHSK